MFEKSSPIKPDEFAAFELKDKKLGISDFETPPCSKVRRRMRKKFERDVENSEYAEDSDYQQGSKSVSALDYLNEGSPSPKLKTTISKSCSEVRRKSKERSGTPASLKRSYSETFSGEDDKNTCTPKQEVDSFRKLQIMGSTPRSSLSKHSSKRSDESHRRKSYPTNKSYDNHERRCLTDQTPYRNESPDDRQKRQKTILPRYSFWDLPRYESKIGFIDSHCHLDFLFQRQDFEGTYEEYQTKYKSSYPPAYQGCIAVFCNPFTFPQKSLWRKLLKEENVWASFGCHPHNAKDYNDKVESQLCEALEHPRVRALGEIGLDYSNRNNCLKEQQHRAFQRQLKIAIKKSLPLVIHCRQAQEDCIRIMKEIVPDDYFIHLHCFTDTWSWAKKWLDTFPNLFIGITNVVTFPSAETVHEVAKNIPLDRLLLETDAPYFVPRPIAKGSRWSHPGMAIHVAAQIAAIKNNISLDEVFYFTRENTRKMYNV